MEHKTERKCETIYKKECKPVQKPLEKTICETGKNQQCRAIPVRQCHTTYSTISKTIQHRQILQTRAAKNFRSCQWGAEWTVPRAQTLLLFLLLPLLKPHKGLT